MVVAWANKEHHPPLRHLHTPIKSALMSILSRLNGVPIAIANTQAELTDQMQRTQPIGLR